MTGPDGMFLVCDRCGYCCFVPRGSGRSIALQVPACPGCGGATRLARREPWREALDGLNHAS